MVYVLTHQLHVLGVREDGLAEVDATIDDALLLLLLQDAGDDGLRSDTEAAVVDDHGAQSVEPLQVHCAVHAHALQVISLQTKFIVLLILIHISTTLVSF